MWVWLVPVTLLAAYVIYAFPTRRRRAEWKELRRQHSDELDPAAPASGLKHDGTPDIPDVDP
jgi:hypothetical protein